MEQGIQNEIVQTITVRGEINLLHKDKDGNVKEDRTIKNLILTAGKGEVAGLINEATTGGFKYIGIGTGTTSPVVGNTTLETEIASGGGSRAIVTTNDRTTTTTTNDTARCILTFTFSSSFAVTEAGLFDAVSSGVLLARQTFSAINVVSTDTLQITWKIQVS